MEKTKEEWFKELKEYMLKEHGVTPENIDEKLEHERQRLIARLEGKAVIN